MNANFQPYEGTKPYIFISYARKDGVRARSLLEALHRAGYRVWYYKVQAGRRYDDVIAEHIIRCSVFFLLLSRSSANSDECYEETSYARHKKRIVVPVYLDAVELPPGLELRLHSFEYMRLSDYGGADHFALALRDEEVFAPCKAPDAYAT